MVAFPSGIGIFSPKITDQSLVRKFVALNGYGYVAITIYDGQNAVDPDPGTLQLQVWFDDVTDPTATATDPRGELVITADPTQINRADTGMYDYPIGPAYTGNRGVLTAQWTYQVNGSSFTYNDFLQILDQMPQYEALSPEDKLMVQQVSWMFGDLFYSTEGGLHLIDEFQTHFDYERISELAAVATTRFNYTGFPVTTYTFSGPGATGGQFNGLLMLGTYLEVVRHAWRTYIEIPAFPGMNVTYTDRRDYAQRWENLFNSEWSEYQTMVKMAKRELLQLGRGALLLGGGFFGSSGARSLFLFSPYNAMTRAFKFYPAAAAISFPATRIP